jgi:hypothetical protein
MAHDVFISYSSKDKAISEAIVAKLEQQHIHCWMAPRDILPGQNYAESIIRAINSCKVFVLFWTANSNTSGHVLNEINQAFNQDSTIIPFRIEAVEPTLSLIYYISRAQWLDAFTPPLEEHVQTLAGIIFSYLGRSPETRPEALPAPPANARGETVLQESGVVPPEGRRTPKDETTPPGSAGVEAKEQPPPEVETAQAGPVAVEAEQPHPLEVQAVPVEPAALAVEAPPPVENKEEPSSLPIQGDILLQGTSLPAEEEKGIAQPARQAPAPLPWKKAILPAIAGIALLAVLVWLLASGAFRGVFHANQSQAPGSTATTAGPVFTDTSIPPTATATPIPPTATATTRPSPTATPLPAWIKDFSAPILNALANRPADIQDDFSKGQLNWNLSTYNPGVDCSKTTETISNGRLQLKTGPDMGCYAQANHNIDLSNYVLQLDVDLSRLSPEYKASIILKSQNLTLRSDGTWGVVSCPFQSCFFSEQGKVALDLAHPVTVMLISFGGRYAFYVNGVPVHYSERSVISTDGLRLDVAGEGGTPSSNNIGEFDNLKIWDLYKIDLSSVVK